MSETEIQTERLHLRPVTPQDSGPFTEAVLLGNLAIRLGKRIEWDGPNLRATNAPEAEALIRRSYRKGWEI